jgi:predicted  nucleic acid-binding Zn-ribbon protein
LSDELDRLWALKDLDERAVALRAELKRFPEQRATLERAVSEQGAKLERHRAQVSAGQLRRRELEREIDSLTAQERKYQGQTYAVKKNEEYRALLDEIEGVKKKRSDLETEVLMTFEAEERLASQRAEAERALQAAQREAAERTSHIDAEERADRERLEAIEAERARHIGGLPPATRSRYERIVHSRDGRAVVAILKGACGGCFRNQPPQVLQEARRRDRLLTCEGCGRLVIWPPNVP